MFYKVTLKDHLRVPPLFFGSNIEESVMKSIRQKYEGLVDPDMGVVVDVSEVKEIGEGAVISGDGAAYYETSFSVIVFKPELHEVMIGRVKDITDFGAFMTMGPIEGMIHVSQTMDDFVSFSKEKVLAGRDSKKMLKVNDVCRARLVAASFKDVSNPKIGLTMRQEGLGKIEWLDEASNKAAEKAQKVESPEKKDAKKEKQ